LTLRENWGKSARATGIWHFFCRAGAPFGMASMRCSSWLYGQGVVGPADGSQARLRSLSHSPSRWRQRRPGPATTSTASTATRVIPVVTPVAAPVVIPVPAPLDVNSDMSGRSAVPISVANFLERLGQQASYGFGSALRKNPGGGAPPRHRRAVFRSWGEAYGISSTTNAQGDFAADHRQTWVAWPGSRARHARRQCRDSGTKAIPQSTFHWRCSPRGSISPRSGVTLRSTRARGHGVRGGPWIRKDQFQPGTPVSRRQRRLRRHIDGGLTELSYYWSMDQSRIVPKRRSNMCVL